MFDNKDYEELEEAVEPDPEPEPKPKSKPKAKPETKTLKAVRLKSGLIVFE